HRSVQSYPIVPVPSRRVGQNDLVARRETLQYLDGVDRRAADLHRHTHGVAAAFDQLEQADSGVGLPVYRPPGEHHTRQTLDLDRAVDGEIGTHAARHLSLQLDVHLHCAVADGGVDANHTAFDDTVTRVDPDALVDLHVARLRLRYLQRGLHVVRARDPGA